MSSRRYYRCDTCLSVLAVESGEAQKCGACDGSLEFMGGVVCVPGSARMSCACDARCVFAVGPHCSCKCDGAHHGSGLVVELSPDGVAKPSEPRKAREKAAEWRAAVADFESELAGMNPGKRRRAVGVLRFARECRVHRLRLSYLRDFARGQEEIADVLELDLGVAL